MMTSELMKQPAITCRSSDNLNRAAQLMWDNDVGAIPVTNEDEQIVGMITDRDISMAAYTTGLPLSKIQVEDSMANVVYSCGPSDGLTTVEKIMEQNQVRRVPVVDEASRPIGMVSLGDIARHVDANPTNGVNRKLVRTMAGICAPRQAAQEADEDITSAVA